MKKGITRNHKNPWGLLSNSNKTHVYLIYLMLQANASPHCQTLDIINTMHSMVCSQAFLSSWLDRYLLFLSLPSILNCISRCDFLFSCSSEILNLALLILWAGYFFAARRMGLLWILLDFSSILVLPAPYSRRSPKLPASVDKCPVGLLTLTSVWSSPMAVFHVVEK